MGRQSERAAQCVVFFGGVGGDFGATGGPPFRPTVEPYLVHLPAAVYVHSKNWYKQDLQMAFALNPPTSGSYRYATLRTASAMQDI